MLSGIDKNKTKVNLEEVRIIAKTINKLVTKQIESYIVYEGRKLIDIVPFSLNIYKELDIKKFDDYNSALDFVMTKLLISALEDEKSSGYNKKIKKIENVIEKQKEKIREIGQSIKENEKKAEIIYSNYNVVIEILAEVNKATKKYSWKEIQEKLKGHKIVKEINPKDKKIMVEL